MSPLILLNIIMNGNICGHIWGHVFNSKILVAMYADTICGNACDPKY